MDVDAGNGGEFRLRESGLFSEPLQVAFLVVHPDPSLLVSGGVCLPLIIEQMLYNVKYKNSRAVAPLPLFVDPEQVVDGDAEGVGQIPELIVCDDSVAGLDPADLFLCDVQPRELDLCGELLLR